MNHSFTTKIRLIIFTAIFIMLMSGCAGKTVEEWAYNHDPGTTILKLSSDGKAEFLGVKYSYTLADDVLTLTAADGTVTSMRFIPDGENQKLLYETFVYEYTGEGEPSGVLGTWQEVNGNLSFEFTDKGTFREDYYSPGYYSVDEENGVIKLVYNDHYADTYIYYKVEGRYLTVDYPWTVVPTEK